MNSFAVFIYLNLLDILSTMAVLHAGGREANPVTLWIMGLFPGRVGLGLLLGKIASIPIYSGLLKWSEHIGLDRVVILRSWNFFYMALVVWNLSNLF